MFPTCNAALKNPHKQVFSFFSPSNLTVFVFIKQRKQIKEGVTSKKE